ncbi:dihydroorotase [Subsaximicrobium wynnwilliamsii]|uniref:Dihydroorotase n=1 Tax=Subsaximicrobium wynnwilliamsii TaxID=291179 RepID=A0A5C6ZJL1_9FLAO|nr:dihydroorotase [Subsaximicrobium wynnwilliamsii]TXD81587.1 dihydroorotase [Subsaximicrobium wynnwilliamsii]TXD89949.1 dihydroorotase [Subsaximicrobium wynnwilliamsii]TXE01048.1 dihydroorotase [Subsaximicrobium wynnwilliamsii]
MKERFLIKNTTIVNEGESFIADVLLADGHIQQIGTIDVEPNYKVIDGTCKHLLPGIIDAQVHFRDPGLTHKGDLYTESRAAIAGGVTSFIDMPNTVPNILTVESLKEKYEIASKKSLANYAFFLGVNGDNIDAVIKMDTSQFIGVSDDGLYFTKKGNLLADNPETMEKLFANCKSIIAIHSEKEQIVEENERIFREKYGEDIPAKFHPIIRNTEGCYEATKRAINLAKKHNARLHILHLTTEAETHLFQNDIPLQEKKITTEVSVHHLWFSDKDYEQLGMLIKWNPAIKTQQDKEGLLAALLNDRIDIITTDHAPHTLEEKQKTYFQSMSGAPMVQHSLNCMLEFYKEDRISLEKIVEKMCHNPAILYGMTKRGFIREGYYADLTLVDLNSKWTVEKDNLLYKCGWSPLEGTTFQTEIKQTFVNGNLIYDNGVFQENIFGMPIVFNNKQY